MFQLKNSILIVLFIFQGTFLFGQSWVTIPSNSVNLYDLLKMENTESAETYPAFEMSTQILYHEYKVYLAEIKKDSSLAFYKKQLPDSSICLDPADYQEYISDPKFDNSSVAGISWEAAINFCYWKTLKDNPNDKLDFFYRLPILSEWLMANEYFKKEENNWDWGLDFSDWLQHAFDESAMDFAHDLNMDYIYDAKDDDPPVLKRKHYKGRNFVYNHTFFYGHYGYSYRGYRNISFRLIKVPNANNEKTRENLLKY